MASKQAEKGKVSGIDISEYKPESEPFYVDVNGETKMFMSAYRNMIPVMLKGPTGCGKSRFVERMAYDQNQQRVKTSGLPVPLVTVACHEDLTADDLKGRHLLDGTFMPGAALVAVQTGGMLYLDEIVEARNDTTVVIHPLADHRRTLTVEKLGKVFKAPDSFMLVISYNPGYQKKTKDLKMSTKQRFVAINFDYPSTDVEAGIIMHEAGIEKDIAHALTEIGQHVRNMKSKGLQEGASTRLLIDAGKLIKDGIEPLAACRAAILNPIIDDVDVYKQVYAGLEDVVKNFF